LAGCPVQTGATPPDNGGLDTEIWLASLRIGEPSIDDEHESLLNLLHRLRVASPVADKSEGFSTVLNAIGQQLSTHFEHEEEFFKKYGMPDVDVRNQADSTCKCNTLKVE